MKSSIDSMSDTRNENEEWGHFIDVDHAQLSTKNRTRAITYPVIPVIRENKVYQAPYTNYIMDNNEDYRNLSYSRYAIIYMIEKIISPLFNLFIKQSHDNGVGKGVILPLKVRSLIDIRSSKNDETVKNVRFQQTVGYTYTIDETSEDCDEKKMYKNSRVSMSTMATVSIVSIYVIYILF